MLPGWQRPQGDALVQGKSTQLRCRTRRLFASQVPARLFVRQTQRLGSGRRETRWYRITFRLYLAPVLDTFCWPHAGTGRAFFGARCLGGSGRRVIRWCTSAQTGEAACRYPMLTAATCRYAVFRRFL